ncbi:hypothetical protein D3C73_1472770 [compost metagenome]
MLVAWILSPPGPTSSGSPYCTSALNSPYTPGATYMPTGTPLIEKSDNVTSAGEFTATRHTLHVSLAGIAGSAILA